MADPIVISDDSDSESSPERSPDYTPWRVPRPLDFNPGPSYGRGTTSPPVVTPGQVPAPPHSPSLIPVTLNSPLSPEKPPANPVPRQPLALIDLTDDTNVSAAIQSSDSVIDLTEKDEEKSPKEVVCTGSHARRSPATNVEASEPRAEGEPARAHLECGAGDAGDGAGEEVGPVCRRKAAIPERRSCDSVASSQSECSLVQGCLSPVSSCCTSHNSPDRACSPTFGRGVSFPGNIYQPADTTTISSDSNNCSHGTTVPSHVENFYQIFSDSSEEKGSGDQKPEPIPETRVQRVINTIEANFPEATVQCLAELVTPRFYPPKEILNHLIRKILLGPNIGTLLNETFNLLTKIQELHPASISQVVWDWELLSSVMQEKEKQLPGQVFFLRYVTKTLQDDFQKALKQPLDQMKNTIASSMLSCDRQPHNIKDIAKWLVGTLSGPGFPPVDNFPLTECRYNQVILLSPQEFISKNGSQLTVLYLQKMLAIAVDIDQTPTCSSTKIAEILFGFLINIPERNQRDAFFTSMESHLLRCKVLENLLHHSCEKPTTLPLSFAQILYFLNNATSLYSQNENTKWEGWDELVEHLQFLLISYKQVLSEHLRVSMKERKDAPKRLRLETQQGDDITALDVEQQFEAFRGRMEQTVGGTMPFQLQEKLFLLKLFFLQAIHGKPLLESRFQGGDLMRAYNLLSQEFPSHD